MAHVSFPKEVPTDCVIAIYNAWKAGSLFTQRRENAEHLWVVVGFALGAILTDDNPLIGDDGQTPEQEFEAFHASCKDPSVVHGKIDWKKVLQFLLTVILPLVLDEEKNEA